MTNQEDSNTPKVEPPKDKIAEAKREIIIELSNAYFETYRYDRPNDSVEQLSAFCRDIATNDVDELLKLQQEALLESLLISKPHPHDPSVNVADHDAIWRKITETLHKLREEL